MKLDRFLGGMAHAAGFTLALYVFDRIPWLRKNPTATTTLEGMPFANDLRAVRYGQRSYFRR